MADETQVTTPTDGQGQTTATAAGQSAGNDKPETFSLTSTQLAERLNRSQESALDNLFKGLGVKNADDLKAIIKAHAETEKAKEAEAEAKKTEIEQWQGKHSKLEKDLNEARALIETFKIERQKDTRNRAILKALTAAKVSANDSEDLLVLLEAKQTDLVSAVLGEGDKIDEKAVEKLVKAAKESYARFFAASLPGMPSNQGGKLPSQDTNHAAKLARAWKPRL